MSEQAKHSKSGFELDRVFHALADHTRRAIMRDISDAPRSISEVAKPHKISLAAVSKHVRVLEDAGLLSRERKGRTHMLAAQPAALADAHDWLRDYSQLWQQQLVPVDDLIAESE